MKLLPVLAILAVTLAGCGGKAASDPTDRSAHRLMEPTDGTHHVVTPADSGRKLAANIGDTIIFTAPETPGTGIIWAADFDSSMLMETGSDFVATTTEPEVVGAPGVRTMRFSVKGAGSSQLVLTLKRPYERSHAQQVAFAIEASE